MYIYILKPGNKVLLIVLINGVVKRVSPQEKKMKYKIVVVNQAAFEMGVPFSTAPLYANY